jgi:hypothetical protein
MSETIAISKEIHQKLAMDTFNKTWDLLDKTNRSEAENVEMIYTAHASRYHWGQVGTPLEFQRGEWQISRVYAVLGMSESALYHAEIALKTCEEKDIGDFDLAFAYEALTRAYSIMKNASGKEKNLALAKEAGKKITDEENRDYFLNELETIS